MIELCNFTEYTKKFNIPHMSEVEYGSLQHKMHNHLTSLKEVGCERYTTLACYYIQYITDNLVLSP